MIQQPEKFGHSGDSYPDPVPIIPVTLQRQVVNKDIQRISSLFLKSLIFNPIFLSYQNITP